MQKLVEVERSPEWMEAHGSSLSPDSLRVTKVFNVGIFEAGDFSEKRKFSFRVQHGNRIAPH